MTDPLSIAASVAGFLNLAKTCIDLYEIISDARHAAEDLDQLVAFTRIERLRFLMWCEYVGIVEALAAQGPQGDKSKQNIFLIPELQKPFILNELEVILRRCGNSFQDARAFLERYVVKEKRSFVSDLQLKDASESTSTILVNTLWSNVVHSSSSRRRSMSVAEQIAWTVKDKRKFKSLVESLRLYNDSMRDILNLAERTQLERRIELVATTTPIAKSVRVSGGPANQDGNRDMHRLVELLQRNFAVDADIAKKNDRIAIVGDIKGNSEDIESRALLMSHMVYPKVQHPHQTRLYTVYENTSVLVEWKYYSLRIPPKVLTALKRRVDMLTMQLQLSSETSGFGVLNCLGYLDDPDTHRVGIVFQYPVALGTEIPLKPVSLRERLILDRRDKIVRDLGERFKVARYLVMSIFRLHSVGWLHKSIRSENILFFERATEDQYRLENPYLCGFDFSRQDSPGEMTENVPTLLLEHYVDFERSQYRHPDLDHKSANIYNNQEDNQAFEAATEDAKQLAKDFRYQKTYDIYSLGIVLVEIGLWCPIKDLTAANSPISAFRDKLLSKYLPELRYRMGERYYNVVVRCLSGSFGTSEEVYDATESRLELKELKNTRIWLESKKRNCSPAKSACLVLPLFCILPSALTSLKDGRRCQVGE